MIAALWRALRGAAEPVVYYLLLLLTSRSAPAWHSGRGGVSTVVR